MMFAHNTGKGDTHWRTAFRALMRRWWIGLIAAALVGAGLCTFPAKAGSPSPSPARQGPSSPSQGISVAAVAAGHGDVGIYLTGLGAVTPIATVTIKSRVDGELMKVLYQEGQIVNKGALLAEIDPRPFEAQLTQAEGQLVRDQALLDNARLDLRRYETLSKQDSIAQQLYDTQKALVHQYEGAVKIDQGQIDTAKLNLIYSRITAPVTGRVGLRLVDPGNIIHTTDTNGLVVITQLQPMTVIFTISEDNLPPVLDKLKAGARLQVDAYNRELTRKLATGPLLTVDNEIDPTTGTVRLRAEFPNKDNELFPQQFVNARLLLDVRRQTTVVPAAAIQQGPQGKFVYVVKADQTVEVRPVTPGPAEGGDVAIDSGLSPGELVMVAQATALSNEITAIQILGSRMSDSVLLIQALGGGWNSSDLPSNRDVDAGVSNHQ